MTSATPTRLMGSVAWVDYAVTEDGVVETVILVEGEKIIAEFTSMGRDYEVKLMNTAGAMYDGEWSCKGNGVKSSGKASCRLYKSDDRYLIFGKWKENEANHHWWAELTQLLAH